MLVPCFYYFASLPYRTNRSSTLYTNNKGFRFSLPILRTLSSLPEETKDNSSKQKADPNRKYSLDLPQEEIDKLSPLTRNFFVVTKMVRTVRDSAQRLEAAAVILIVMVSLVLFLLIIILVFK